MFFRTRQEKFPREFRIYSYDWDHTKVLDLLNRQERKIEELESQLHNFTSYAQQLQDEVNELEDELKNSQYLDLDSMKDIILRIWRVNNKANYYKSNNNMKRIEKMVKENDDFDEDELNYILKNIKDSLKPVKYVEKQSKALLKVFKENGFEIKDHTNSKYYDGMALNVLVFETDDEIEESIITETIKPSIFYKDELILNGEVVVTTPAKKNE